jgi:hypothetical protein
MTSATRRAALTALASARRSPSHRGLSRRLRPSPWRPSHLSCALQSKPTGLRKQTSAAQSSEQEEEFSALCDLEGEAHWNLAETPCATDADFIAKIAYLLRHEQRLWGETLRTYDGQYGALAFAIELHLEERDEWRSA